MILKIVKVSSIFAKKTFGKTFVGQTKNLELEINVLTSKTSSKLKNGREINGVS
jgi:hypothetical protein